VHQTKHASGIYNHGIAAAHHLQLVYQATATATKENVINSCMTLNNPQRPTSSPARPYTGPSLPVRKGWKSVFFFPVVFSDQHSLVKQVPGLQNSLA
jgi:hypothetical protein